MEGSDHRSSVSALPIWHGRVDRCIPAWLPALATRSKAKVMSAVPGMDFFFFFFICTAVGDGGCWSTIHWDCSTSESCWLIVL